MAEHPDFVKHISVVHMPSGYEFYQYGYYVRVKWHGAVVDDFTPLPGISREEVLTEERLIEAALNWGVENRVPQA